MRPDNDRSVDSCLAAFGSFAVLALLILVIVMTEVQK